MEKTTIEIDGKKFYILNNRVLDTSYLEVPLEIKSQVLNKYYQNLDYKDANAEEMLKQIKEMKILGATDLATEVIEYGLDVFSTNVSFVRGVLPIYTSCLRAERQSQKAINIAEQYINVNHKGIYESVPLLTSLASAYCDTGNYTKAKKCCDYAYKKQGGGTGFKTELSLVYSRIAKESQTKK